MEILTADLQPVAGVAVGHWTDANARTGCTVIRFDRPALTAVEVRGAAPGSRELDLLQPGRTVQRPDAILLTGGSAMGLAAAEGVVDWMREHERGFPTVAGRVPIVPAAVLFDLAVGAPAFPTAVSGHAATAAAVPLPDVKTGPYGAGTGATVGNIGGPAAVVPGGLVMAQTRLAEGTVTAIVAVNAYGVLRGQSESDPRVTMLAASPSQPSLGEATTLMACVTDIALDHAALMRMTVAMHDALAREIVPAHTIADGDIAFASTVNETGSCPLEQSLRASLAAELAVEAAIGSLRTHT